MFACECGLFLILGRARGVAVPSKLQIARGIAFCSVEYGLGRIERR